MSDPSAAQRYSEVRAQIGLLIVCVEHGLTLLDDVQIAHLNAWDAVGSLGRVRDDLAQVAEFLLGPVVWTFTEDAWATQAATARAVAALADVVLVERSRRTGTGGEVDVLLLGPNAELVERDLGWART